MTCAKYEFQLPQQSFNQEVDCCQIKKNAFHTFFGRKEPLWVYNKKVATPKQINFYVYKEKYYYQVPVLFCKNQNSIWSKLIFTVITAMSCCDDSTFDAYSGWRNILAK